MCQGEGANVALESDKEDDDKDARKVSFSIYNVSFMLFAHFFFRFEWFLGWRIARTFPKGSEATNRNHDQ